MASAKHEVLSVRADLDLLEAMKGISNRSEFVRNAILAALDNVCPFCRGSGMMKFNQKKHWDDLFQDHYFTECECCQELRLVCSHRDHRARMESGESLG
jgi:hypothetical protein